MTPNSLCYGRSVVLAAFVLVSCSAGAGQTEKQLELRYSYPVVFEVHSAINVLAQPGALSRKFEVASVRRLVGKHIGDGFISPDGSAQFIARDVTLSLLIGLAFGIDNITQLSGQPEWLDTELYDVTAKPEDGVRLTRDALRPMLLNLLQERFHLRYHRDTQVVSGYVLIVKPGAMRLRHSFGGVQDTKIFRDRIRITDGNMAELANALSHVLDQPVLDQTGLAGEYDIDLRFAPIAGSETTLPSLSTVLQEQGLRLFSRKVPSEKIIIEHVDKEPTEN